MRKFLLPILGTMFAIGIATFVWASVIDTPHDIVPGTEPCAFCHTPHMGTGDYPLWNRINDSDPGTYDMYQSTSFDMVMPAGSPAPFSFNALSGLP